jgi:hypothetical protein
MSTYQPPGGQPDGTPYAQPQDPWAEPGVASVPTDPIPQQYDPYPGSLPGGQIWSQETVAHGAPYGYGQPQPGRGKLIALVVALLVVLGGAGGYAAWYIVAKGQPSADPTIAGPTGGPSADPSSGGTPVQQGFPASCPISGDAGAFDPCAVKEGDCLFNDGTAAEPDIRVTNCDVENSYKVLKVSRGASIKEGPGDVFDKDTTSVAECKDTNYLHWYGYQDALDDNKDIFLCLTTNG